MSPMEKTLYLLRSIGYKCGIVEHWNSFAHIRQDLFGIIDIVAVRAGTKGTLYVQTTTLPNHAAHADKILCSTNARDILESENRIWLVSWQKASLQKRRISAFYADPDEFWAEELDEPDADLTEGKIAFRAEVCAFSEGRKFLEASQNERKEKSSERSNRRRPSIRRS